MKDKEVKVQKIIKFSGETEDWAVWKAKFLARARRLKYKVILTGDLQVPNDEDCKIVMAKSDKLAKEEKETCMKNRALNEEAYEDLLFAMPGDTDKGRVVFNIVHQEKDGDFEEGDSRAAWVKLLKKFEPDTAPNRLIIKDELRNIKQQKFEDPEEFVTKVESKALEYKKAGGKWDDDDTLEHVCYNINWPYKAAVRPLKKRIGAAKDPLDMQELLEDLRIEFAELNRNSPHKKKLKDNEEVGLFAGGFKGKCNNCGKWGHKAVNCPDKNQDKPSGNGDGKGKGKFCKFCRKPGHTIDQCWKLQNKKLKEKLEQANISLDDDEEEDLAMMALSMDDLALETVEEVNELSQLFIGDSGASVHMTGSLAGMVNLRDCNQSVKTANGGMAKATKVGDKKCFIKDSEGKRRSFVMKDCKCARTEVSKSLLPDKRN